MIYQPSAPSDRLEQGDILRLSDELVVLLDRYHPYYSTHPDNKFFVVLTQSCDLVPRPDGCKARYISLAPVRPLKEVVKREFDGKLENVGSGTQPFTSHQVRANLEQFLGRLFNNNEPPFFYYEAAHASGIYADMCAMLALPISFKPEHYETFRAAKIAGITDVFQAKLGWLLGQMYSRVGTPDFQPTEIGRKVKDYTDGVALWLEEAEVKNLRKLVQEHNEDPNNGPVGKKEIREMLKKLPKQKNQVIDAVLSVITSEGLVVNPSPERFALRKALERDSQLAQFFK